MMGDFIYIFGIFSIIVTILAFVFDLKVNMRKAIFWDVIITMEIVWCLVGVGYLILIIR